MKQLIFILVFVIVAITAKGQTKTFDLAKGTHYLRTHDYVITNTTAIWFRWLAEKQQPLTVAYQCVVDSTTGDHTNMAISLWGREFENDSWEQIGDTYNNTTSGEYVTIRTTLIKHFREFKSLFTPTGTGTSTVSRQELKIYLE